MATYGYKAIPQSMFDIKKGGTQSKFPRMRNSKSKLWYNQIREYPSPMTSHVVGERFVT